jgi:hypothetical protein
MKTIIQCLALAGLLTLSAAASAAGVTVVFSHPEDFRDMPYWAMDREQVLKDLSAHFGKLGARLAPGEELHIEVLDVDLAGRLHPNFSRPELRIVNGNVDWPTMRVRYRLTANGNVTDSGEDRLSDMMFLGRTNRYYQGDALRFEKVMIDDWFRQKFSARRHG